MMTLVSLPLWIAVILVCLPVTVFSVEIAAALIGRRRAPPDEAVERPRIAVLVPAHDEERIIQATLADIVAQLRPDDRLLVVADNCSDRTARVAAAAGAEVLVRTDPIRRGKGFALDFGVQALEDDPPAVLIVVDADCRVERDALDRLARRCAASGRPVQALYLMSASPGAGNDMRVAEFAWRVKNDARPSGLHALGLPCQLMGTGMAFPWDVIRSASLADESIVEDLKLGLELASEGKAPLFCPTAIVRSHFPETEAGAASQRQRWEHGHITMILSRAPPLLAVAIRSRDAALLALVLDMAVPPLALLVMLVAATVGLAGIAAAFGSAWAPLPIAAAALLVLAASLFASWRVYGRDLLPASALPAIGRYVLWKARNYPRALLLRTAPRWIRTDRTKSDS